MYNYIRFISNDFNTDSPIYINKDLKDKSYLNPQNNKVFLDKFISCLDEIKSSIDLEVFKEKISYVRSFYEDEKITLKILNENAEKIKDDISFIYSFRNRIVHDAQQDNLFISFYMKKVRRIAITILHFVIKEYNNNNTITIEKLCENKSNDYDTLINDLQNGKKINLTKK